MMDYFVVFCNKYAVRVPLGDAHGCLEGRRLVEAGNAYAAESCECLGGTLGEFVDATVIIEHNEGNALLDVR